MNPDDLDGPPPSGAYEPGISTRAFATGCTIVLAILAAIVVFA